MQTISATKLSITKGNNHLVLVKIMEDKKMIFETLAKECISVESYVNVLRFLDVDNKFNLGRKQVLKQFTEIVIKNAPLIKFQIEYIHKIYLIALYP